MIIDIHTHCFPDSLAPRAISALTKSSGLTPFTDGTAAGLKGKMADSNIDLSVILPIATKPEQTTTINRWSATIDISGMISFGTLHPCHPDWKSEIKWLASHGFKGIKFHPEFQDFFVDDPDVLQIYDAIFDAGLVIIFHAGEDISFKPPFHCTPKKLKFLLDTFPGAPIIAAHMGGYNMWNEVEDYLIGHEIYLDTSFSLNELGIEKVEKLINNHGHTKIVFGSDIPWGNPKADIDFIKSLSLNTNEINNILGNNAKKLLNL